ncbi:universal stress protein [Streptomyces fragilis]|uniref:Universal stress protein n=1 Tax=Streptomyces fragilis TaxID=67301 RepID=A0ABV2YI58_9ACTN|nr:universal stress protein [Streptomyces fragilis]
MTRTITVGLDGSPESLAAAEWAAHEAFLRDLPLRLVNAADWQPAVYVSTALGAPLPPGDLRQDWSARLLDEARARLARRHPELRVESQELTGQPVTALLRAAEESELLVLGSRGLGRIAGFLIGSFSQAVLARSERPVVVVRPGVHGEDPAERPAERPGERSTGDGAGAAAAREIVLGLDLEKPGDEVIAYAFAAAARSGAPLRVVHGWTVPPYLYGGDLMPDVRDDLAARAPQELSAVLRPWREKFPDVEVRAQAVIGGAGSHLIEASGGAALVVVGRRIRRSAVGTHIGPVVQALLHHAAAPVAVVPHE